MKRHVVFRLLAPVGARLARQLAHPRGWFGRSVMTRALNRGNRELIEATLGGVRVEPRMRVCDVGFGGGLALRLARQRGALRLAGVDPSAAVVERMRERPPRWLAGAELVVEQAGVEAIPFPGGAFDVVVSTNTVYFWPDLGRAFSEVRRVLRGGGTLAVGFSGSEKLRGFDAITRHGFHLHENKTILEAAVGAGFEGARLETLHGRVTEGDFVLRG